MCLYARSLIQTSGGPPSAPAHGRVSVKPFPKTLFNKSGKEEEERDRIKITKKKKKREEAEVNARRGERIIIHFILRVIVARELCLATEHAIETTNQRPRHGHG